MSKGRWISTVSGRRFYYGEPSPDMVDIGDIATSESNLCRFTGQIEEFYSIAEHSVLCSYIVPQQFALCALLHDATEPYVNDLASPLKRQLPEYCVIENRIWCDAIAPKFNLPTVMPVEVKRADIAMFQRERIVLQPWTLDDPDYFQPLDPEDATKAIAPAQVHLALWEPRRARFEFLKRYRELTL